PTRVSRSLTAMRYRLPTARPLLVGLPLLGAGTALERGDGAGRGTGDPGTGKAVHAGQRGHLALPHLAHHLLHHLAALEELVDLLDARAGAVGDADAALAVDHVGQRPLAGGHRED